MTDLKPEDLVALREIAEKATQGEWAPGCFANDEHPCDCKYVLSDGYMGSIATISVSNNLPISEGGNDSPPPEEAKANLRHIAAFSPDVCLSLLADRARMEKALEEVMQITCPTASGASVNKLMMARKVIRQALGASPDGK